MATNLPSCFSIQFLEQLLKFLVNFTLLKYVKSQGSYGFLITKERIFGFQILDLKDHFSAFLNNDEHAHLDEAKGSTDILYMACISPNLTKHDIQFLIGDDLVSDHLPIEISIDAQV